MPTHHSVRLDNDQSFPPVAPETGKQNSERTVSAAKPGSFDRPFHDGHLLSERKVFQSQIKILFRSQKYFKQQF
jgi:hypothetical protein